MYMMCPDEVGRDSGDWGGQESEVCQDLKSHQELGEEALTERTLLGIEAERPKILSDCCCCGGDMLIRGPGVRDRCLSISPWFCSGARFCRDCLCGCGAP